MTPLEIIGLIIAAIGGGFTALVKMYRFGPFLDKIEEMPSTDNLSEIKLETPPVVPPEGTLLWDTPQHAFHSTRVLCDELGLNYDQRDELCATIYGESEFDNRAVCKNRNTQGEVTSIDVGICQWNSYWHCGDGKTFPSTDYVVANPEKAVRKMIAFYKNGQINLWVAHKSGRYAQFLKPTSPMWKLA